MCALCECEGNFPATSLFVYHVHECEGNFPASMCSNFSIHMVIAVGKFPASLLCMHIYIRNTLLCEVSFHCLHVVFLHIVGNDPASLLRQSDFISKLELHEAHVPRANITVK